MNVVGHNAESIEFELVLFNSLFEGIYEYLLTFMISQLKLAVVATGGDVVTIIG